MIKKNGNPLLQDFSGRTQIEGKDLRYKIQVFAGPIVSTDSTPIHSILDIRDDDNNRYGHLVFPAQLTESEVQKLAQDVHFNPTKYKDK